MGLWDYGIMGLSDYGILALRRLCEGIRNSGYQNLYTRKYPLEGITGV